MPESSPVRRDLFVTAAVILGVMTILRLVMAWVVPIVQDEAYYALWGSRLAWGYFDHPPLVAFMASTAEWAPGHPLFARLGTILCSLAVGLFSCRLFVTAGLSSPKALGTALILSHFNLMGLVFGFLTTPDTVLLLGWTWGLDEALRAVSGRRSRWLLAGVATGVGLLAKYTMLLIGPVYLWILWRTDRDALKTPWPYLGGFVALLVFMPNIAWNADNDWITFRFQMRHGFQMERPEMPAQLLPEPLPPDPNSPEAALGRAFDEIEEAGEKEEKKPRWYDEPLSSLNRYVGYYASQIAVWGALLWPMFVAWRRRRKRAAHPMLSPKGRTVLLASTVVPLVVFGLISLFSKVEANWSAMYLIGAAGLVAPALCGHKRPLLIAAVINVALLGLTAIHANTGIFAKRPHRDRLLQESHGFENLAERVKTLEGPKFADSYQLVSMMRFYEPELNVLQWPGITRHSELTRDPGPRSVSLTELISAGHFWLVTTDRPPPRIRGFYATSLSLLRDCHLAGLQEITRREAARVDERCKKPIHEWYLVKYETF